MDLLTRPFLWIRSCHLCYRFTLFTRMLLAAAFIPTGMVKLLGQRFTLLPPENPIGAFFEAMYQTGMYWQFLGLSQVVAGVLLLVPRFAHLGAAVFLPIIANIFVLTVSLGFRGTWLITGLMMLAVLWLVAWDFHRFRPLLTTKPLDVELPERRLDPWERVGFGVVCASLLGFFLMTRDLVDKGLAAALVILGVAAGLATVARFLWVWWTDLRRAPAS